MPGVVEGSSLIVLTFSDVVIREEIDDFPLPRQGGQEDGGTGYILLVRIDTLDQGDANEEAIPASAIIRRLERIRSFGTPVKR